MTVWREDILGQGFECTDLDLGFDDEGPLVATLVRALPAKRSWIDQMFHGKRRLEGAHVLYVHGWSDYFFQRDLAAYWTNQGATFYALDLRKYGRSLRDGQTAGYIDNLDDYHEEIDLALEIIMAGEPVGTPDASAATSAATSAVAAPSHAGKQRRLILMGHSTGGLVLSLWADKHPDGCDALVLNSPWLEFQLASTGRQLIKPLIELGAHVNARDMVPQLDSGFYWRAQRQVCVNGELDSINTQWRPERSHPVLTGWLRAVLDGHARVSRGLHIQAPVVMLLSVRSALTLRWNETFTRADSVLDVDEVAKAALKLGPEMTALRIDGAIHDVFLSAAAPRAHAYAALDRWVAGWSVTH